MPDVNRMTVAETRRWLAGVDDPSRLDEVEQAERAGKNRKGVLDAVRDRRDDFDVTDTAAPVPAARRPAVDVDEEARVSAEDTSPGDPEVADGSGPGPAGDPGEIPDLALPEGGAGAVTDVDGPGWDVVADEGPAGGGLFRTVFHVPRLSARNPSLYRAEVMQRAINAGFQPASGEVRFLGDAASAAARMRRRFYGVDVFVRDYQPSVHEPAPSNPTGEGRTDGAAGE